MKFDLIVADPPWSFSDKLDKMKATRKRGAHAHYNEMTTKEIASINVKSICADNALLALWVPGTHIFEAKEVIDAWGFTYKQNAVWAKMLAEAEERLRDNKEKVLRDILKMGMGRIFRQCHETVLISTRGKIVTENKGQRSVIFAENKGHSSKPEYLQDSLELILPKANKLEMFGRRRRKDWVVIGNEIDGLDINEAVNRLKDAFSFTIDPKKVRFARDGVVLAARKVLRSPPEDGIVLL